MTFVCVSTTSLCCLQDVRAATTKARADLTGAFASKRPQGAAKTAAAGAGDGDGGVDMDFGDDYEGEKESKATRAGSKLDAVFDDGSDAGDKKKGKKGKKKAEVSWDVKDADAAIAKRMAHKQAFLRNPRHVKPPAANQLESGEAGGGGGGAAGQGDAQSESWETVSATGTQRSQGSKPAGEWRISACGRDGAVA